LWRSILVLVAVAALSSPAATDALPCSIARTIVETYGGKIWAENRNVGDAVFRFILPLSEARPA
jgi:signal transduction histidine kinase